MEENKAAERTMAQVNDDYYRTCIAIGDKTYKIKRMQMSIEDDQKTLMQLDLEAKMMEDAAKAKKGDVASSLRTATEAEAANVQ